MTKNSIKYFICFLLLQPNCTLLINESEPHNDYFTGAESVRPGHTIKGTYYSPTGADADYILIPSEKQNRWVKGSLSGVKGIDAEISVYTEKKRSPLKTINDENSSIGEKFGPIFVPAGKAWFRISPLKAVNSGEYKNLFYEFSYNVFNAHDDSEREPNENFETATLMNTNRMTGYFSTVYQSLPNIGPKAVDTDCFRKDYKEKKKSRVSIELTGVEGIDTALRIFTKESGTVLVNENPEGKGETAPAIGIEGPTTLFICIGAQNKKINQNDFYELKIHSAEYESKYELEPNDSPQKASELNREETEGELSSSRDTDYFVIRNQNEFSELLFLEIIPREEFDIQVEILPEKNRKGLKFNDAKTGKAEGVSNYYLKAGSEIFIKVFTTETLPPGAYPYKIKKEKLALADIAEIEPNNFPEKANEINPDTSLIGYINPNYDIDVFQFKTEEAGIFRIMLESPSGCRMKLKIIGQGNKITREKSAKSAGSSLVLTTQLSPDNQLHISCARALKNLYKSPYKINIVSQAYWEE